MTDLTRQGLAVRPAEANDYAAIAEVETAAFEGSAEARLVEDLRNERSIVSEMVALRDQQVIAHILYSRAHIAGPDGSSVPVSILAPMAVRPDWQRKGIGTRLISDSLRHLDRKEDNYVFVLGHVIYYPRFGFSAADAAKVSSPWPGPAFMLRRANGAPPLSGDLVPAQSLLAA